MARVRGAAATEELAKKSGGGKYLTLEDGDEEMVAFVGVIKHGLEGDLCEPFGCEVVWIESATGRHSVEFDPKEHDESDARSQFAWNVLVRGDAEDGSQDEVKIFQQGPRFFKDWIRQKDKKGRSGYTSWFTLGRTGSGQFDTKYTLDREDEIDDADLEDLKSRELHDLEKEIFRTREDQAATKKPKQRRSGGRTRASEAARGPSSNGKSSSDGDSNASGGSNVSGANGNGAKTPSATAAVISDSAATELRQMIKDMPNASDVMDNFKKKFEVDKLKDLKTSREGEARAWLGALKQTTAPAETQQQEVDPFE